MSNPSSSRTPLRKPRNRLIFDKHGATPTRAGDNFVSSTDLGHTQQEIKSSLWGRILRNEPGIITDLIKPHLVDGNLVAAIEQALGESPELKAARDLLFKNAVPEDQMYTPMIMLLRHISTFNTQPESRDDASSLDDIPTPTSTSNTDPIPSVSTLHSPSFGAAEPCAYAPSPTTSEQIFNPSNGSEPLSFPDDGENHGLCINRTWVDTHASLLHTDRGLYVSVRGIKDAGEPDGKRSRDGSVQLARSKVARTALHIDAATTSHSNVGDAIVAPLFDRIAALDTDETPDEQDLEDETPEEAVMDDRKPDISLIDLPHSDVVPTEYLWRQCAVFMEVKKHARDGPLSKDNLNARRPEGEPVVMPQVQVCKSIITQMADNARIVMATRPFLRFCVHIAFCGPNFNLALFDRNGAIISRTYHLETHLGLFIRVIRRLSCEMTAYDLGLDTTVRPERCLGSSQYPSYLVKLSDEIWYRTEGVPLWQSTSLLGRGTLVFNAQEYSDPNGPLRILKNAWREDGRLKESELYGLMQKIEGPFKPPKALAKCVVGGDVPLHGGNLVAIEGHRARVGTKVIGNGATVHRLVLESRGKSLASYTKLKQLLKAAWAIVVAHKALDGQGILHGDLSYGNTFLFESARDHMYGFLADLDLASVNDTALDKLPRDTANILKEQRGKGARSGTVIFMAVRLLRGQVLHLQAEKAARRKGKHGPLTLSMKREAHHDLEAFLWVLVYAMMVHHYNSLTHDTDRAEYKEILDEYFGHGSANTILKNRIAMIYSARAGVDEECVSHRWFPDPHEQRFFIRCMTLIGQHDRKEAEEENFEPFKGKISDENPVWDSSDEEGGSSPDEDAEDQSGTYKAGKASEGVQKPVAGSRKRAPVITYESVTTLLKRSIGEL